VYQVGTNKGIMKEKVVRQFGYLQRYIEFFFASRLHWQYEMGKKFYKRLF